MIHDIRQARRGRGRDAFIAFMHRTNRCYRERIEDIEIMSYADGRRARPGNDYNLQDRLTPVGTDA